MRENWLLQKLVSELPSRVFNWRRQPIWSIAQSRGGVYTVLEDKGGAGDKPRRDAGKGGESTHSYTSFSESPEGLESEKADTPFDYEKRLDFCPPMVLKKVNNGPQTLQNMAHERKPTSPAVLGLKEPKLVPPHAHS
ncbi:hypothetical protein FEM48_Zijuj09G0159000 [Ziziphus jujuba var. spinosa]|uniref:Uncharacterized protein n=1 Tax=Ziziphus jujuba var. spinosa TaxID=714518 RepID=A0A978UTX1_ZIZJJ|nr:hypothetical protein FEM48_Zijuj09G0159000 [Ziziphus jujuba var. spinosa]